MNNILFLSSFNEKILNFLSETMGESHIGMTGRGYSSSRLEVQITDFGLTYGVHDGFKAFNKIMYRYYILV